MSQRKGPNAAVSPGSQRKRALAQHLVPSASATFVPPKTTAAPSVIRAPSYDPANAARIRVPSADVPNSSRTASPVDARPGARAFSRGAAPALAMQQGHKYVISPVATHRGQMYKSVASPPLSQRGGSQHPVRQASRSPPPTPFKYSWEPVAGAASSGRRVTPVPAEPVTMAGAAGPLSPTVTTPQQPARVRRISSGPFVGPGTHHTSGSASGVPSGTISGVPSNHSLPSSQSLPSVASCPTVSGVTTQTLAPTVNRGAQSASVLPVGMPALAMPAPGQAQAAVASASSVSSMPTLHNDAQAPWAQVIMSQTTARMGESQPAVATKEDLEQIRRELNQRNKEEADQKIWMIQKDLEESHAKAEGLKTENGRLRAEETSNQKKIQDAYEKLQREIELREQTERSLARVSEDYNQAVVEKDRLEERQKQEDAALEQEKRKCAELERHYQKAQEQYQALDGMRNAEKAQAGKKEQDLHEAVAHKNRDLQQLIEQKLEAEANLNKQLQQQSREVDAANRESRELKERVAILEEELRQAQDEIRRTEQQHHVAQQEVRELGQRFRDCNKENEMFQGYHREHKKVISGLETRLRQEQDAAAIVSPGDFLKFMKANEDEDLAQQNSMLRRELAKRQMDLELCNRKIKEQGLLISRLDAHN